MKSFLAGSAVTALSFWALPHLDDLLSPYPWYVLVGGGALAAAVAVYVWLVSMMR